MMLRSRELSREMTAKISSAGNVLKNTQWAWFKRALRFVPVSIPYYYLLTFMEYLACPGCRLPFDVEDIVAVQASKKKKIVTKAKELPYKPKKGVDYLGHRA